MLFIMQDAWSDCMVISALLGPYLLENKNAGCLIALIAALALRSILWVLIIQVICICQIAATYTLTV